MKTKTHLSNGTEIVLPESISDAEILQIVKEAGIFNRSKPQPAKIGENELKGWLGMSRKVAGEKGDKTIMMPITLSYQEWTNLVRYSAQNEISIEKELNQIVSKHL